MKNKKTVVSVHLEKGEYEKLKKLSVANSRSMASFLRFVINEKYNNLTPLEKSIIQSKEV